MNKQEYLQDEHVKGFLTYFYKIVSGEHGLNHGYSIDHAEWKKWATGNNYLSEGRIAYYKWGDLLPKYFWAGGGYKDNSDVLDKLSTSMKNALILSPEQPDKVLIESIRILDWGQTYKGTVSWLIYQYDKGELIDRLNKAIEILVGDEWGEAERLKFRSKGFVLRMDSGLTKIYSLASTRSIIYDGRVAAAMALLVVYYLDSIGMEKPDEIPANLNFAVDKTQKNNKRAPQYIFHGVKSIQFRNKNKNAHHAESNIWANWILQSIVDRVKDNRISKSVFLTSTQDKDFDHRCLRELEAALFMMGSRIDGL